MRKEFRNGLFADAPGATVSGSLFTSTVQFAAGRGLSLDRIADVTGVDAGRLSLGWATFPDAALRRLWKELAAGSKDEAISLSMGAATPMSILGPLAFAASFAPDVRSALRAFVAHSREIASGLEMHLDETANHACFTRRHPNGQDDGGCTSNMMSAVFLKLLREFTGATMAVRRVTLMGERTGSAGDHQDYFGGDVQWSDDEPSTSFYFDRAMLDTPLVGADGAAYRAGLSFLDAMDNVADDAAPDARMASLLSAVEACCRRGRFDVRSIAQESGLSVRTAQRLAKANGAGLYELIDHARLNIAFELMTGDQTISLTEIAEICGYSDERSFRRAFKRWTGQSPGKLRNERSPI
ncbi:MAG: AraC family transcriptional regulator ligand-binding domain-containing protein [Pseudomonadota bacterium]